jgi:hypothetical protein
MAESIDMRIYPAAHGCSADVLKTLDPGQVVGLTIQRGETEQELSVTLADR